MVWKMWIICCCTVLAPFGFVFSADGPASFSREDIQKYSPALIVQLRSSYASERQKAVEVIRKISESSARTLSDNLPQWLDPLIENGNYDDVLQLTRLAITDRAFDITTVEKLQEARVRAWLGKQNLSQALIEAKGFYNVSVLSTTPYAIDLLANILERQGRGGVASRLHFEQSEMPTTQPAAVKLEAVDESLPLGLTVLSSIKIDPLTWQQTFDGLASSRSYGGLMAKGNLCLLMDHPAEAKKFFEAACGIADSSSSKAMREAIEGIARAIKAESGSSFPANALILAARQDPTKVITTSIEPEKIREVAQQVTLVPVRAMTVPPLEIERQKHESEPTSINSPIYISAEFESASPLRVQNITRTHFRVTLNPQVRTLCDWFLFRVDGAKGQTVRIDLKTDYASLDRWWTLNPVCCEATDYDHPDVPPTTPFSESLGIPLSGAQSVGTETLGQSWHYISRAWRSDGQTFSFVNTFTSDHVYVAMRPSYPPSQNVSFLRNLAASNKLLGLVDIGQSRQKRALLLAKIGTGDPKSKPCIVIYAGEHGDEPDGMWAARGAIEFLVSNDTDAHHLRDRCTFLIIPQLDPDASAKSFHEGINTTFLTEVKTPESIAYANWFQEWVNAGHRLDLIIDLHNMQSSEMGHVQCWLMEGVGERGELAAFIHYSIVQGIQSAGFEMVRTPTQRGWSPDRLGGWLDRRYGPLCFLYELNSQAPQRHLTLLETKKIGETMSKSIGDFLVSANASKLLNSVDARRRERKVRWANHSDLPTGMDAIQAEAAVSPGFGIVEESAAKNATVEKWVP